MSGGRKYKYDWHTMQVGDARLFKFRQNPGSAQLSAYRFAKRFGLKMKCLTVADGVRIERVQ